MDMVSMKSSRADMKEASAPMMDNGPQYPWGLQIHLDDKPLEKLGLKDLPKVGTALMLMARVEVQSVSSSDRKDGDPSRSVGLQITHMCLESEDKMSDSDLFYGKEKE